jgi:diguanylate cyclase (GGDEF)-like protein
LDYLKDPVVVLARDGRVLEVNTAFSELAKVDKQDIVSTDCRETEPLSSLWNSITGCILYRKEQSERITFGNMVLDASIIPIMSDDHVEHICIVLKDISSFVNLEKEIIRKNKELIITNTLSSTFISSDNLGSVFNELLEKVLMISDISIGWIVVREDDAFVLKSLSGASRDFIAKLEGGKLDFLYNDALKSSEPLYVLESSDTAVIDDLKKEGIVFLALMPLRVGIDIMGFLVLASRVEITLDFDFISLLSLIGNSLSVIAEKIRLFQETRRLAITDALTGLYNIRYFYDVLNTEMARTQRYSTPFSLVLFDIDDFKSLNDTYGHQAGDDVLRTVADILKYASRKTDTVARYGGEEFIALLPNTPKGEAFKLATRIKDAVEQAAMLGDERVKITLSGGVATFPEDAPDAKSLLNAADIAMYEAKAAGKKQICCYRKHGKSIQKTQ